MRNLTTMLPVCSATLSLSPSSQILLHVGTRTFCSLQKAIQDRCITEDKAFFGIHDGIHSREISFKTHASQYLQSLVVERPDRSGSFDSFIFSPYPNEFDDMVHGFSNDYFGSEPENRNLLVREGSYPLDKDLNFFGSSKTSVSGVPHSNEFGIDTANEVSSHSVMEEPLTSSYIDLQSSASPGGNEISNLPDSPGEISNVLSESASSTAPTNVIVENPVTASDTFEVTKNGFSNVKENMEHFLSGVNESVGTSIVEAEGAVNSTYNAFKVSVSDTLESITESFDTATSGFFSLVDNSKEQAGGKLVGFSSELKENLYRTGSLAIDILKREIIAVEDYLVNAATFVVYSYGSAKSLLPPDVRNGLNLSEEKAIEILRPVGAAFQQVYMIIEGFERRLGLDPNDPLIPLIFLLSSSATIGISYWLVKYGGYSGDLSPELTLELLKNEDNAVLIDVRPEVLREKDGVPDLRRGARFKYVSVTLPEINVSVSKLLKSGRDIDDALLAVVIRNLKIIQDESKVIVMDASGSQSKGIARSLRTLGVKKPYLVQGGFRSWVKSGLRIKELKPETALTVLNEEAEAILEDIRPTPELVIGFGLGISVAIYALLEWEKTLQVIGIIGLGQTLYQKVASYESSEDLKKDVRLLLSPVRLGTQAFSWASTKLEPNRIGLPTSPSSTAVQDRVLQAAAKHESQPSDSEETEGLPRESSSQTGENLDLSEA